MIKNQLFGKAKKTKGKITIIASDETVDRDGEVLELDKWDFANFKKNPVMLWGHDHMSKPIGKVKNLRVEDKKLKFEPEFAKTEEGEEVRYLFEDEFLKTVSVGFHPIEKVVDGTKQIMRELLEISAVALPANTNAVVEMEAKGYKFKVDKVKKPDDKDEQEDAKEQKEKIEKVLKLWKDHKPKIKLFREHLVKLRKELKVETVEDEVKQIELVYHKLYKVLPKEAPKETSVTQKPVNLEEIDNLVNKVFDKKLDKYPLVKNLIKSNGKET